MNFETSADEVMVEKSWLGKNNYNKYRNTRHEWNGKDNEKVEYKGTNKLEGNPCRLLNINT